MKTKLLKKWRKEALRRVGVFKQDDGKYQVVFDKGYIGNVDDFDKYPEAQYFQVVCEDLEDFSEAVERCDSIRRIFILREARRQLYGKTNRLY